MGDLVVLDTGRAHRVGTTGAGLRLAASCFIGVQDTSLPLAVFA